MMSPLLMLNLPGFTEYENYPKTVAWLNRMKALPYYEECNKEGLESFKILYDEAVKKAEANAK